jgi:threonine/homoserine/homoserine lactone efflux protein
MFFNYLWKGIIIGLSASIPLGPIGVLCIQRTLNKGRRSGFISGLGAAAADGFYAIIAGFSVSIVIDYLTEFQLYLRIAGSIVLFVLGYSLITTNPAVQLRKQLKKKRKGLFGDFISIFALTVSNPITVFVFAAVFAGFHVVEKTSETTSVLVLIIGILTGASIWWFTLSSIVSIFKEKFRLRNLLIINRIAGILVIAFGGFVIATIFFDKV